MFSKADFGIDTDNAEITCPAGNTTAIPPQRGDKRRQARFAAADCGACGLKARCTARDGGRIVEINPHEELLAPARAQRREPEFLARYRQRSQAEPKTAHIKARTKRLPWRGLANAATWLEWRVAALNLDRAGRLGIIGRHTPPPPRPPPSHLASPTAPTPPQNQPRSPLTDQSPSTHRVFDWGMKFRARYRVGKRYM